MKNSTAALTLAIASLASFTAAVFAFVVVASLSSCNVKGLSGSSSQTPDTTTATCAAYCVHLRSLGCPGGSPSPSGATCETRCASLQASIAPMDLACRAAAASCAAADACETPHP
jgi:hypothetical protein